jgi:Ca-activated chloride channel family protein
MRKKTKHQSMNDRGRSDRFFRFISIPRQLGALLAVGLALVLAASEGEAAGTLTPKGSSHQPIRILDHHVKVILNNGFAQTEVTQTFFNPNDIDLEAVYRFPVPKSASLSEVTLTMGEREIDGEVVARGQAETIYESEKKAGNDAGLATKDGYQAFEFRVHPVRAQDQTRIRLVYYQPIEIDTGIGRYLYPLEEGGTDEVASGFWSPVHDQVEGNFSVEIELKSAWPVADVRLPGFENETVTDKLEDGHYRIRMDRNGQPLNRDLVVYYRLAEDLPGRVEVIPYRDGESGPGTFMMVVTPGLDLKPIERGADYIYVLDTSGSMSSKIHTLTDGVSRVIGKMSPEDRYRIVTFSSMASDFTKGWKQATPENVERTLQRVCNLSTNGSTNIYDGLTMAMSDLNADRATSIVLVTDGVTNTGIVDTREFHKLSKSHDIRVFGFLLGNSSNWPLMRTICEGSGGFYAGVSNADDILGQIMQAKSKILHECLHDAEFSIKGVRTFNTTGQIPGKIYRGQQLVMFGQYDQGGEAELILKARMTGEDKIYRTKFTFPENDTENPEIERLWALDQIEQIELQTNIGIMPAGESSHAIRDLGLQYQLVTDETSMLVLDDDAFQRHGIERRNKARVQRERSAQAARSSTPSIVSRRVDAKQPFTPSRAPSLGSSSGGNSSRGSRGRKSGGGGGSFAPLAALLMGAFAWLANLAGKTRRPS